MASFSSLPNELLIEIWRHVLHPEDIESFALTSHGIRALAKPFLEEHRALKDAFSTYSTRRPVGKVSAAALLKEITIHPRVALYVKRLVIDTWRDSWESPARQFRSVNKHFVSSEQLNNGTPYFHKPYAETDMRMFEQVVKRNEYAFGKDMFEVLIRAIRDGREDPIVALLLLLLTNLKYLVVLQMKDHPHFSHALQHVSNARDAEALRCLSDVQLLYCAGHADDHLLMVKAFATLPSVKRISCKKMSNAANHHRVKFNLLPRSSNVESLTFQCLNNSGVDMVAFSELIKGFKSLKRFIYKSLTDHKMFAIRNALVAHARFSLNTLRLVPCTPTRKSVGSFRGFKALKELEINHTHLADFDPRRGLYSVDVLPSSLEELHLHHSYGACVSGDSRCIAPRRLGRQLLEERDRHVPNLKLVTLWDNYIGYPYKRGSDVDAAEPGIAELQAMFLAKGLRLELLNGMRQPMILQEIAYGKWEPA